MRPFVRVTAIAAPLLRNNVDTDAIIPSREMRSVSKTGLAAGLFAGWRYSDVASRTPDPAFVLNQPAYAGAEILITGDNFGCGSSREHAVWALAEFGFRAVIAVSFNPIFQSNCVRNGVAPVVLAADEVERLAVDVTETPAPRRVTIDLEAQTVSVVDGPSATFVLGEEDRAMLLEGLDAIDLTMKLSGEIARFREVDRRVRPWVYLEARP